MQIPLLLLRLALVLVWLPAAAFWRFAALQGRLQTRLDHMLAQHQSAPPPAP